MDPWEFGWSALAAIGQIAGAIATFIAVIVALYVARLPFKKRIKIRVSYGYITDGNRTISVDAINVGNRSIKVSMMGFLLDHKQLVSRRISQNQKILMPADSTNHYLTISELQNGVTSYPEIDYSKKLYAFVRDEEGKVYKKRTNFIVSNLIRDN